ncbi:MAG: TonB-dependent receptor [Wenzhouxiangellaceae bacterium]
MKALRSLGWLTAAGLLAVAPYGYAQQVSNAINGIVLDANGNPVANAQVEIVHVPSGTTRVTETQSSGRFTAQGLRIGGPYRVTATKEGQETAVQEDIFLNLSDPAAVQLVMASQAELDRLQVTGMVMSDTFTPDKMGSGTNISRAQIEDYASISRSINDFVRFDPRAVVTDEARGELSVGGGNSRFNNLLIDGVASNDAFGLNANGQPSTNQQISIDWLEEISVQISPYDVTQTGSSTALVNAVTKSGTNDFEGGARFNYRDDSLVGDGPNNTDFIDFDEKTYGAWLGGPIIKDKLFFFGGYEKFESDGLADGITVSPLGGGGSTEFGLTEAQIQEVINAAQTIYGFNPGNIDAGSQSTEEEKWIVKLDWNIATGHRASLSFNRTTGSEPDLGTRDNNDFSLTSGFYQEQREIDRLAFQVFSDWSSNFSTELRFADSSYETNFDLPVIAPNVEVRIDGNDVIFGTELFRQANNLQFDTQNIFFKGSFFTGLHTLDFGIDWSREAYNNLFLFGANGNYRFDSLDDFINGNTGVDYELRLPIDSDNIDSARTIWDWEVFGLFLQDTWQVTSNLNLQYGLRIEHFNVDSRPLQNNLFQDTFGFSNQGTITGENVYAPRVGFNWQPDLPFTAQLRGGIGIFRGRSPGVWQSNAFTNSGETIRVFACEDEECTNLDPNFGLTFDPNNQPQVGQVAGGRQDVDVTAPGFRQPTDLKYNLAWDMELPFLDDTRFTIEYEHAEVIDGIFYQHLNLGAPTGTLPDGRNIYWTDPSTASGRTEANRNPAFNDVLLLRNTSQGERTNVTAILENSWQTGIGELFARAAFSYGSAFEVNPGTSSRAVSNWGNNTIVNPNDEEVGRANNEISNRFTLLASYTGHFFDFGDSVFSLFFESRSGRPFTWTFNDDANGDGRFGNDRLFVPNPGDVQFVDRDGNLDPAGEAAFFALVNNVGSLSEAQGGIACRNCARAPRVNQLDFRFIQEVDLKRYGKLEFFFEVENLLNLIDSDWGDIREAPFPFTAEPVEFEGIDPVTGQMRYRYIGPTGNPDVEDFLILRDDTAESRWSAQFGVVFRY